MYTVYVLIYLHKQQKGHYVVPVRHSFFQLFFFEYNVFNYAKIVVVMGSMNEIGYEYDTI